jgi:hypothetical protein
VDAGVVFHHAHAALRAGQRAATVQGIDDLVPQGLQRATARRRRAGLPPGGDVTLLMPPSD